MLSPLWFKWWFADELLSEKRMAARSYFKISKWISIFNPLSALVHLKQILTQMEFLCGSLFLFWGKKWLMLLCRLNFGETLVRQIIKDSVLKQG